MVLVDVASPVSFSSLKKLCLDYIIYPGGDESVNRLLSNCPFLEDLFVNRCPDDNVTVFTVRVPSLKILYMRDHKDSYGGEAFGIWRRWLLMIVQGFCVVKNEMPNIVTADFDFYDSCSWKILSSITSVRDLCLCLSFSKVFLLFTLLFRISNGTKTKRIFLPPWTWMHILVVMSSTVW